MTDKEYESARNKFIPEAEKYANLKCKAKFPGGNVKAHENWTAKWNLAFHTKMNELYNSTRAVCPTCGGKGVI